MICLSMRSNLRTWMLKAIGSIAILLLNTLPSTALFAAPIPITKVQRAEPVVFEKEILPMLQKSCLACHNASKKLGALSLESPEGMKKGGDSGPAMVPGKGDESLMVKLASHQDEPVMPPTGNKVNAVALTSDELGLLRLWIDQGAKSSGTGVGLPSPKQWQSLSPSFGPVFAVALTADGQIVAASRGNRLYLYHAPSGQLIAELADRTLAAAQPAGATPALPIAHRDLVESLAFNLEGDLLASGSFREVKIWRRPNDVKALELAAGAPVTAVAVSSNQDWIATALANHTIRLWNAKDGKPGPTLTGHVDKVTSLRFSLDNAVLLSASQDRSVRCWRVADGAPQGMIEAPAGLNAVEFVEGAANAPPILVTAGADNMVRSWTIPESMPAKWELSIADLRQFVVSRDGRHAALADGMGNLRVVKRAEDGKWQTVCDWKLDRGPATAISFLPATAAEEPPYVVTGSADGSLTLRKAPQPAVLRRWRGSPRAVTASATSADGKLLASGAEHGGITLWKNLVAEPAKEIVPAGRSTVSVIATHSAKRLVALAGTAGGKPAILIQNLENGQLLLTLTGHEGVIRSVAFSADGNRLVSGSDDQTVRLWDLTNPQQPELKKFMGQGAAITAVAISPDLTQVFSAGADNKARVWNVADGMPGKDFAGHAGRILSAGYLAANQPFTISVDRTVRFWNPADGQAIRSFEVVSPPVSAVLTADGKRVVVASEDKLIRLYDLASGQLVQTCTGHQSPPLSLQVSGDGKRLISHAVPNSAVPNSVSETIVWELEQGRLLEWIEEAPATYALLDGPMLDRVTWGDANGRVWSQPLMFWRACDGNMQPITALAFHAASQAIISAAKDGSLRGYQTETGQATFNASHGGPILSLAVAPNDQWLATGGENAVVRLWAPGGGAFGIQQIAALSGPVRAVAISADSTKVIAGLLGEKPAVIVADATSGAMLQRFAPSAQALAGLNVVGDRGHVLAGSLDGVWQLTLNVLKVIPGHTGAVTSLAAIPGVPQQVFSGSLDGTIRRWNLENGQATAQLAHGAPVLGVAVRPDGQRLASVSDNKTARLWNINGQQIAELRGDLRRRTAVTRLTQQQLAANDRLTVMKQQLDAAEKEIPVRTDTAQKAAAALATANTDVTQKQTALNQASEQKIAAEKGSIAASAEARKMQIARAAAETMAKSLDAEMQIAQQRAAQRTTAANAAPNDATLKQAATEATQAVTVAQQKLTQAQQTVQTATAAAQTAATAANEAAQKVTVTQKPFTDAMTALRTSQAAQRLAMQQNDIAVRDLEQGKARVPVLKDAVAKADAQLAEVKKLLETATLEATTAEQPIRAVAFSPDGRLLATAGDYTSLHAWDGETGAPVAAFAGHKAALSGLAFAGSSRLVSVSADQSAYVWELNPAWQLERTIGAVDKPDLIADRVMSVDFSSDSSQLLVGGGVPSRNGELHLFKLADGSRTLHLPQAHDDVVHSARISPDGRRIASGGADKYMRTFEIATGQVLRRFEGHTNYVLGVAWKSDGQTLATSSADNTIKVWDAETADQRLTVPNMTRHITAIRFVGSSDIVVSSSGDKVVRMHQAANGGNIRNFPGAASWVHCVDATPGSELVAAGTADGSLLLWNGTTTQLIRKQLVGEATTAKP